MRMVVCVCVCVCVCECKNVCVCVLVFMCVGVYLSACCRKLCLFTAFQIFCA